MIFLLDTLSCRYKLCILFIAIGFTNGTVKILDALNLTEDDAETFRYSRDAITHIKFSHDSQYLATTVGSSSIH